jgi:DNA-binding CsgD family transcriptional regulator
MQQERPQAARAAMAEATSGAAGLAPREELLMHALQVGLARRTDDTAGLVRAWQLAREGVLHGTVDLYNLLPLGELLVGAARLRDARRLEPHLDEAWALLDRLGEPPLWSVVLRWSAVQAAILSEQPSQLPPHAAALVRASRHSHLASLLAAAGRSWLSVLAGTVDPTTVETAARGLASVGMAWDGSRLAGHAAAHAEERKDMTSLLACARDLRANPVESGGARSEAGPASPSVPIADQTGLSAREREVARFVLEGKTYREIGEAMFISPRTAEHHIARIRRRLGVRTRQELLARLRLSIDSVDSGVAAG